MTAEVCLMNRMGVALAADSAVTLVGDDSPKIYNSADKLFLLSEQAPVGIMVYGSSALMQAPWETLVKLYRVESEGAKPLATVKKYAEDFLAFLHRRMEHFPASMQDVAVRAHVRAAFQAIMSAVEKRIDATIKKKGPIPKERMPELLGTWMGEAIDAFRVDIKKRPRLKPAIRRQLLFRRCSSVILAEWRRCLEGVPTTRTLLRKATSLVIEALGRNAALTNARSGVVVAGFGKDEIFPSLVSLHVYDVVADRVRLEWEDVDSINAKNSALIVSFAQKEMVHLFMEGIDPNLETLLTTVVERLYRSLPDEFANRLGTQPDSRQKGDLDALVSGMLPKMWQEISEYRRQHFTSPVTEVVSHLPKDELAAMAETLVNLTSFRRRVSTDAATVGGPIDVAVITKGDGFVWIRRKHYFDPALNPRYIARHYR